MKQGCCTTANIVAGGLGLGLVAFFICTAAAIAAGGTPPTALWAVGAAVSGALAGLLVPSPNHEARHEAAVAALDAIAASAREEAARERNAADGLPGNPDAAATHEARAREAGQKADSATAQATAHRAAAAEPGLKVWPLAIIFVVLLVLAVVLSAGAIVPPPAFDESLKGVTTAVLALASAAGSAIIGIYAPSPSAA